MSKKKAKVNKTVQEPSFSSAPTGKELPKCVRKAVKSTDTGLYEDPFESMSSWMLALIASGGFNITLACCAGSMYFPLVAMSCVGTPHWVITVTLFMLLSIMLGVIAILPGLATSDAFSEIRSRNFKTIAFATVILFIGAIGTGNFLRIGYKAVDPIIRANSESKLKDEQYQKSMEGLIDNLERKQIYIVTPAGIKPMKKQTSVPTRPKRDY